MRNGSESTSGMRPIVSFGSGAFFACSEPQPANASRETTINANHTYFFNKRSPPYFSECPNDYWNSKLPSICAPVFAYETTVSIVSRFSS